MCRRTVKLYGVYGFRAPHSTYVKLHTQSLLVYNNNSTQCTVLLPLSLSMQYQFFNPQSSQNFSLFSKVPLNCYFFRKCYTILIEKYFDYTVQYALDRSKKSVSFVFQARPSQTSCQQIIKSSPLLKNYIGKIISR